MEFMDAVKARRSEYVLGGDLPCPEDEIVARLEEIAGAVPSSFNSQSARMVVLFGDDHRAYWKAVEDILGARSDDPKRFEATRQKLAGFSAAAGTILFYEIDAETDELVERFPTYSKLLPVWAEHGNAIMQFAVWTGLRDMGIGASIQHYNPLIDARAAEMFSIPDGWRLVAQMVFGSIASPAGPKRKLPGNELVSVGHL